MRPLIAANWKMHGEASWTSKPSEFEGYFPAAQRDRLDIVICPPSLFLSDISRAAEMASIATGAQNCHFETKGAHTGEISADMIKGSGARWVILGHSERRAQGEKNNHVKAKVRAALTVGLKVILCVGESLERRDAGKAIDTVENQLIRCLPSHHQIISPNQIVIAYEPIWAIGTGRVPSGEDISAMHKSIWNVLTAWHQNYGNDIRILYGGSVKPTNAKDILSLPHVNGALVGGASLDMQSFAAIAKAAI